MWGGVHERVNERVIDMIGVLRGSPYHLELGRKDLLIVSNDGATRCSSAEARRPAFHTLTSARVTQ